MVIGIDIRPLQTGHKFRGIGEVTKQVTNRIIAFAAKDSIKVLFYEYDNDDPKELLTLPENLMYDVIKTGYSQDEMAHQSKIDRAVRNFKHIYGNTITRSSESTVFLQFAYELGVPKDTRTLLVVHDFIPDIFRSIYFEKVGNAVRNHAYKHALRVAFNNYRHTQLVKRALSRAYHIITVSNSTKKDAITLYNVPPKKMSVVPLGVSVEPTKTTAPKSAAMPTKPYLLFVGAGDARRRVDDLVSAYNYLKSYGHDLQLVLAGENFQAKDTIPNLLVREAVRSSSYSDDILTLGYIDDAAKKQLYSNAIAYVFPTKYEGFGIPVLEAMLLNCPIITYRNSSIPEVGGDHAHYVDDWMGIVEAVESLTALDKDTRRAMLKAAHTYASKFSWDSTSKKIYKQLVQ